jgi:hypothetical protein
MVRQLIAVFLAALVAGPIAAQTYRDAVVRFAGMSADLTFPSEASELSLFSGDVPEPVELVS